jgi:hypothetical protein
MLSNVLSNAQIESARQSSGGYLPAAVVERIVASGIPLEQLMLSLIPRAKTFAIQTRRISSSPWRFRRIS